MTVILQAYIFFYIQQLQQLLPVSVINELVVVYHQKELLQKLHKVSATVQSYGPTICNFIKKETSSLVFCCDFYEFFKNSFF